VFKNRLWEAAYNMSISCFDNLSKVAFNHEKNLFAAYVYAIVIA